MNDLWSKTISRHEHNVTHVEWNEDLWWLVPERTSYSFSLICRPSSRKKKTWHRNTGDVTTTLLSCRHDHYSTFLLTPSRFWWRRRFRRTSKRCVWPRPRPVWMSTVWCLLTRRYFPRRSWRCVFNTQKTGTTKREKKTVKKKNKKGTDKKTLSRTSTQVQQNKAHFSSMWVFVFDPLSVQYCTCLVWLFVLELSNTETGLLPVFQILPVCNIFASPLKMLKCV